MRPKTLMEMLLAKKIDAASAEAGSTQQLLRTVSMDSVSSIGSCTSSMLGDDICQCDDCMLGIVDMPVPRERSFSKKKVNPVFISNTCIFTLYAEIGCIDSYKCLRLSYEVLFSESARHIFLLKEFILRLDVTLNRISYSKRICEASYLIVESVKALVRGMTQRSILQSLGSQ